MVQLPVTIAIARRGECCKIYFGMFGNYIKTMCECFNMEMLLHNMQISYTSSENRFGTGFIAMLFALKPVQYKSVNVNNYATVVAGL